MTRIDSKRLLTAALLLAGLVVPLVCPTAAFGQLYGQNIARPFFDLPNWARFSNCRPGPLPWGYEVFPDYGPIDCSCAACDAPPSVACPGDWVAHRPTDWYATADAAPLRYDNERAFEFAAVGPTGDTALSTNNFVPEFDAGGRFTVGRRFAGCWRVEGTYLGFHDYSASAVATNSDDNEFATAGNLSTFLSGFSDPQTSVLDGANLASVSLNTSFNSGELNFLYWADMPPGPFDVTYLVGARFVQIDEAFNFFSQSNSPDGGSSNTLDTATQNQMWGAQIGINTAWLVTTRWWFDFTLKGAMLNDNISLSNTFLQTINGADTTTDTTATANRTVWLGDLSLMANWQMTPRWTLRAGYQALFFNGLALASDNAVANADLLGTANIRLDDAGRATFHGPVLGVTWIR